MTNDRNREPFHDGTRTSHVALAVVLLFAASLAQGAHAGEILYAVTAMDGTRLSAGMADGERVPVPLGGFLHLSVDARCSGCTATLEDAWLDGSNGIQASGKDAGKPEDTDFGKRKGDIVSKALPLTITTGKRGMITSTGSLRLRVSLKRTAQSVPTHEELVAEIGESSNWWSIADTLAYAVTRESGNTPIAGAGVFVDLPHLPGLRRLRGIVQYALVLHLLPPPAGQEDGTADLGIAPLGVGLFGNRVVMGVGWDISRRGLRPKNHNRYVYIGFSASKILGPKR